MKNEMKTKTDNCINGGVDTVADVIFVMLVLLIDVCKTHHSDALR